MSFITRRLTFNRIGHLIGQQFQGNHSVKQSFAQQIKYNLLSQQRFYSIQPELKKKLDKLVQENKVVLFMKGTKDSPKCGFSNVITQILRMHGVDYDSVNVLEDEEIRQGIKEYSQWPTIPQLFIDGEFIGGCDIVMQMHQNGELISLFNKSGIRSILKDAAGADGESK